MNPGARPDRAPRLVRPYAVTGGRSRPTRNTLDLITVVRVRNVPSPPVALPPTELSPEQERVVALCRDGGLTVAEIAAQLSLPVSVTKVLVSDLVDGGLVTAQAPQPPTDLLAPAYAQQTDALLERVLDGLRNL
ncbi:DUF742 domain-containing protein [Streptomyces xiaopingdaonensis]|uniref:DUF742 domain-containing protein n=1 Tax=Streptomyces xiaopingdaonensis TaxID=1565415 RepID=UPI0002FB1532|nr:DUF742 domain-containing protein [Streptomyces xiaopingdaonensis]